MSKNPIIPDITTNSSNLSNLLKISSPSRTIYSLTDTVIDAGSESLLQYNNHLETCYCIQGEGEIESMDGVVHPITTGTMYALDQHDKHYLRAKTTMRLVCIFSPALQGNESHNLTDNSESSY